MSYSNSSSSPQKQQQYATLSSSKLRRSKSPLHEEIPATMQSPSASQGTEIAPPSFATAKLASSSSTAVVQTKRKITETKSSQTDRQEKSKAPSQVAKKVHTAIKKGQKYGTSQDNMQQQQYDAALSLVLAKADERGNFSKPNQAGHILETYGEQVLGVGWKILQRAPYVDPVALTSKSSSKEEAQTAHSLLSDEDEMENTLACALVEKEGVFCLIYFEVFEKMQWIALVDELDAPAHKQGLDDKSSENPALSKDKSELQAGTSVNFRSQITSEKCGPYVVPETEFPSKGMFQPQKKFTEDIIPALNVNVQKKIYYRQTLSGSSMRLIRHDQLGVSSTIDTTVALFRVVRSILSMKICKGYALNQYPQDWFHEDQDGSLKVYSQTAKSAELGVVKNRVFKAEKRREEAEAGKVESFVFSVHCHVLIPKNVLTDRCVNCRKLKLTLYRRKERAAGKEN